MIWPFLGFIIIAAMLIQLGAMSAWVTVLSIALKVLLGAIVAVIALAIWNRFRRG